MSLRVVVVGASSGIGRATATTLARSGADVVFSARRADALADAVAAVGRGHAVAADVTRAGDAERLVSEAVGLLGGIDLVVYATGVSPLARIADVTDAEWQRVLETNLIGFNRVARAALPHLADGAQVAAISSDSVGTPRPGLAHYAVSKAALDETLRAWRVEHPRVRWSKVAVGPTVPTEFGAAFDPDLTMAMFVEWSRLGMVHASMMDTAELGEVIGTTLPHLARFPGSCAEDLPFRPASGIVDETAHMESAADAARADGAP